MFSGSLFQKLEGVNKVEQTPLYSVVVNRIVHSNEQGFVILSVDYDKTLHDLFPEYSFAINPHNLNRIKRFTIKGTLGYNPEIGETLSIGRLTLEKRTKANYADTINAGILSAEVISKIDENGNLMVEEKYLTLDNAVRLLTTTINVTGIREKTAEKILTAFIEKKGIEETKVMKQWYELAISSSEQFVKEMMLLNVPRVNRDMYQDMAKQLLNNAHSIELDLIFNENDIGRSEQDKIKQRYGLAALEKIRQNPYVLANIPNIGFKKADLIARKMGFPIYAKERLVASLDAFYRLETQRTGDTSLLCTEFLNSWHESLELPKTDRNLLGTIMLKLFKSGEHFIQYPYIGKNHLPMVNEMGMPVYCFTSREDLDLDKQIIEEMRRLYVAIRPFERAVIERLTPVICRVDRGIQLDDSQIRAIYTVLSGRITCLTGGAGCGKTTILKRIIECVERLGLKVALCSPTGKAAKRMSESTGYPAKTIHSLIGYGKNKRGNTVIPEGSDFMEDNANLISADWVFVDESSMIDSKLAKALLQAIPTGTRVTFIGDPNQLPPVSKGCFFYDLIDSGKIKVAHLTTVHRQANGNDINDVAHAILAGDPKQLALTQRRNVRYHSFDDMRTISQGGAYEQSIVNDRIKKEVVKEYLTLVRKHGLENVLLITAKRQTTGLSSNSLNQIIREALYPMRKKDDKYYSKGERIMGIKNVRKAKMSKKDNESEDGLPFSRYLTENDNNILNGEMGTVLEDNDRDGLIVQIDGDDYPRNLSQVRKELTLGYAITVHKSQGSEAKYILTILSNSDYMMFNREWFYTNVTRGKEYVSIYGQSMSINRAVKNTQSRRNTLLRHLINKLEPVKPRITKKMNELIKSRLIFLSES